LNNLVQIFLSLKILKSRGEGECGGTVCAPGDLINLGRTSRIYKKNAGRIPLSRMRDNRGVFAP